MVVLLWVVVASSREYTSSRICTISPSEAQGHASAHIPSGMRERVRVGAIKSACAA